MNRNRRKRRSRTPTKSKEQREKRLLYGKVQQPFFTIHQCFLKLLIKLPQVIPIDEPVAHLKAQRFAAVFRYKLAPCDAGDGVVFVKIPLVGAAGQIKPRRGGNVDQRVRLAVLIQKALLCSALSFCGAAELVQRAGLGQCDDVELLTAGLQVGQAGDALIQQPDMV